MAVSGIAASLTNQSLGTQSAHALPDQTAKASKQADAKVEQQPSSTQVNLSARGQTKNAFAQVQSAGQALADVKKSATTDDIKKAAANFVDTFNKANETGAGAGLGRSLAEGDTVGDLKKVGVTQGENGSLSIDDKTLDKALQANPEQTRSTLANAGRQVEDAAARELADGDRAQLETQRSAQREQAQAAQRLDEQQKAQINNNVVGSLAAYQRTFTG